MLLAPSPKLKRTIFAPMQSGCVILPFEQKACISAVALPRLLAKPLSLPVPNDPACDGLHMVWRLSWLYGLLSSISPMILSGIHLSTFLPLDCLHLFHTPPKQHSGKISKKKRFSEYSFKN